ncbi:unnamed protein product [Sphagnum troendelagicum]
MRIHAKERRSNNKERSEGKRSEGKRSEQRILHVSDSRAYRMVCCGVFFLSHIDCPYPGQPSVINTRALGAHPPPDLARVMAACL